MSDALAGTDKPFLITSGTGIGERGQGQPATEEVLNLDPSNSRIASELAGEAVATKGGPRARRSRWSACRRVHDTVKQGLISPLIELASAKGVSAHVTEVAIGAGLGISVRSLTPDEAPAPFGSLAMFVGLDMTASSTVTRIRLGWQPTGPGLIADLEGMDWSAPLR